MTDHTTFLPSQCRTIQNYLGRYDVTSEVAKRQHVPWLLGVTGQPYYIVAPKYVGNSAGIRVLYALGRALNRVGMRAYMVDIGMGGPPTSFGGLDYAVPQMTRQLNDEIIASGARPIVVYPETVTGNPLNSRCVVRYVANFPGLLGGDARYDQSESLWAFGAVLAQAAGTGNILTVPTSDPRYWTPNSEHAPRDTALLYAPKFRGLGGVTQIHPGALEINREFPSGDPLRELLRRSSRLYLYENSALAIEAILCGCPVVWMPNETLSTPILREELGWGGQAWGNSSKAIRNAEKTLGDFRENYERLFKDFHSQLRLFIDYTQTLAEAQPSHFVATPAIVEPVASAAAELAMDAEREAELVRAVEHLTQLKIEHEAFMNAVVSSRAWKWLNRWRKFKMSLGIRPHEED